MDEKLYFLWINVMGTSPPPPAPSKLDEFFMFINETWLGTIVETKWDGTCVDEYCGDRIKMIVGWKDIVGNGMGWDLVGWKWSNWMMF